MERPALDELGNPAQRVLSALSKAAQALRGSKSPQGVYAAFGDALDEDGLETAILALEQSGTHLALAYASHERDLPESLTRRLGHGIRDHPIPLHPGGLLDQVLSEGLTVRLESAELLREVFPPSLHPLITRMAARSLRDQHALVSPLWNGERAAGVLCVSGAGLGEMGIQAASLMAGQLSAALTLTTEMNHVSGQAGESFTQLFESAPNAYYLWDLSGKFADGNGEAERMTGFRTLELVGKNFRELQLLPRDQLKTAAEFLAKSAQGQPAAPGDFTFIRKDGARVEVEIDAHRVILGGKEAVLGIAREITERKRVEGSLQASEARYRTIFESVNDGIIRLDARGRIMDINDRVSDIFGFAREEVIGKNFAGLGIFDLEDLPAVIELFGKALLRGEVEGIREWRIRQKDGNTIYIEASARLVKQNHKIDGVVAIVRDITRRKESEEMLHEQTETIRSIVNTSQDWIWTINLDGAHTYSNPAVERILGYQVDEVVDKPSFDLMHHEDRLRVAQLMPDWIAGKKGWRGLVLRWRHKDGSLRHLESSAVPIIDARNRMVGFRGVDRDITERKHMEEAEREQRALAEALAETAKAINSSLDVEVVLEGILDGILRVMEYDAADISLLEGGAIRMAASRGHQQHGDHDMRGLVVPLEQSPHTKRMIDTGEPHVIQDVRKDADWNTSGVFNGIGEWTRAYAGAPIMVDGFVVGFIHLNSRQPGQYNGMAAGWLKAFADQAAVALRNAQLYQELTKHSEHLEQAVIEATSELITEKEHLETILANSPDAILLLSAEGAIRHVNQAFVDQFGYSNVDARGMLLSSILGGISEETCRRALQKVIEEKRVERIQLGTPSTDGSIIDAELVLSPILVEGTLEGIVGSLRDISSMKAVERMKDAFVSNVSHELRTPITSLRLNHDLLVRNPGHQQKYVERLDREIDRLNDLIEDLLRLSRLDSGGVELRLRKVDLNELVRHTVEDRTAIADSKDLELVYKPFPEPVELLLDENLLGQALSVLLTNALSYTQPSGRIEVGVYSQIEAENPGAGFYVTDNGPGVTPEELPNLFERFYRGSVGRKSGAPGTGLGLSIAQEIIRRHDGTIEVVSEGVPGWGTTFTVRLPAGPTGNSPMHEEPSR